MTKRLKGFWKRPIGRTYGYNLDVGQHYYSHHTDYLDSERGSRGEAPGALTYGERLARRWLTGRRYEANEVRDRYVRASSATRDVGSSSGYASYTGSAGYGFRGARAQSCTPFATDRYGSDMNNVSAFSNIDARKMTAAESVRSAAVATAAMASQQQRMSRQEAFSTSKACSSTSKCESTKVEQEAQKIAQTSAKFQKQVRAAQSEVRKVREEKLVQASCQRSGISVKDDMIKRVADARMHPWEAGRAFEEAESASAQTRMRISELERELEEITKKAIMTSTHASKTASALAKAAMSEDASACAESYKKSKKVMIESSQKMSKA